ncbi:uncharacterized protein ARMOST_17587 [Armillaria ostoyae]|uniref:Cytochrome P450 n=1 Tax=Armillaria ostoyae TaxID=47428 RepID=A0A284RZE3_ARMOS|nr:uncharacterized protein ARMOST_17587 [Armillaria ostoyae]
MSFKEFVSKVRRVDETLLLGALVLALVFLLAFQLQQASNNREKLKGIPTVGSSGFVASWKDAFRFLFHSKDIIEKGYRKYHGIVFKLSSLDATSDLLQMDYTIGRDVFADPYHIGVVRNALTRNIATCFADVADEIQEAFNDNIPMTEGTKFCGLFRLLAYETPTDWMNVPIYERILQIDFPSEYYKNVNPKYIRYRPHPGVYQTQHQLHGQCFRLRSYHQPIPVIPKASRGVPLDTSQARFSQGGKILRPDYPRTTARREHSRKRLTGKLNDLLSWLLDTTNGNKERHDIQDLITRILLLNLGAIHTTSMVFKTAVYALATHPEYVEILRTEVESAIAEEGWTKAAVGKMDRLDSFLKEAQRVYGDLGIFSVRRTARKDFIFSDGTVVPAGSQIAVAALSTHLDEENYEDPLQFKPWRFSEQRKQEVEGNHQQMVILSLDYLLFGIGRSACPGHFFAVNMLKTLTAHVLLNFDVKIDCIDQFFTHQASNQRRDVFFRKRAGVP